MRAYCKHTAPCSTCDSRSSVSETLLAPNKLRSAPRMLLTKIHSARHARHVMCQDAPDQHTHSALTTMHSCIQPRQVKQSVCACNRRARRRGFKVRAVCVVLVCMSSDQKERGAKQLSTAQRPAHSNKQKPTPKALQHAHKALQDTHNILGASRYTQHTTRTQGASRYTQHTWRFKIHTTYFKIHTRRFKIHTTYLDNILQDTHNIQGASRYTQHTWRAHDHVLRHLSTQHSSSSEQARAAQEEAAAAAAAAAPTARARGGR
jgi:hypothetical protein